MRVETTYLKDSTYKARVIYGFNHTILEAKIKRDCGVLITYVRPNISAHILGKALDDVNNCSVAKRSQWAMVRE